MRLVHRGFVWLPERTKNNKVAAVFTGLATRFPVAKTKHAADDERGSIVCKLLNSTRTYSTVLANHTDCLAHCV